MTNSFNAIEAFLYCIIRDCGFGVVNRHIRELQQGHVYQLTDSHGASQAKSAARELFYKMNNTKYVAATEVGVHQEQDIHYLAKHTLDGPEPLSEDELHHAVVLLNSLRNI